MYAAWLETKTKKNNGIEVCSFTHMVKETPEVIGKNFCLWVGIHDIADCAQCDDNWLTVRGWVTCCYHNVMTIG